MKKLAQDKRFIGSTRIGYVAILHTWGGNLQFHPHLHLVIPGGAISEKDEEWLPSRQDLFVHTKPLAIVFRAKFRDAMKKAHLMNHIPAAVWKQDWVIDSQAVGQGHTSLRYLSRYVFRVAISNNRIKSYDNHVVRFLYKDRSKKKWKPMSLDAIEFIRRFLQHVLPPRFMKVRHYGFLNPNSRLSIEKISQLISLIYDVIRDLLPKIPRREKKRFRCSHCGHDLKFLGFIKPISEWRNSG
ncbi:MAG: transposase [bacterium]